jgi:cytochrome c oxidase cbb3-type subunit 4
MTLSYEDLVWLSKTFGLFYMIGLSTIVLLYVYWPSNRKEFDRAAESILEGDDRPCR